MIELFASDAQPPNKRNLKMLFRVIFIKLRQRSPDIFAAIYLMIAGLMLAMWLLGIWGHDRLAQTVLMFLLWIFCLIAFFVLTGFEVAYTDLRDKDPKQVRALRKLLEEMQKEEAKLYESKEWCSVFVTVAFALIAEWHFKQHVELLPAAWRGRLDSFRSLLILAFTTVPILWLAQGPAKRYATRNSVDFLERIGRPTWEIVRLIGSIIEIIHLPAPSQLLFRAFGVGPKRNLTPSLESYYMMSLKIFGHAFIKVVERVTVHRDGTSTQTLECSVCAIQPVENKRFFKGTLRTPERDQVNDCKVKVVAGYTINVPEEQFSDFEAQVKKATPFETTQFRESHGVSPADAKVYEFLIDPDREPTSPSCAFILEYRVVYELKTGVWKMPVAGQETEDFHTRTFDWPVASYKLEITYDPEISCAPAHIHAEVQFGGTPHDVETERCKAYIRGGGKIDFDMPFPKPGGTYKLTWIIRN